jgi:hypothetical protein
LWLEDLVDAYEGSWPISRYMDTARNLGRFHGAYLAADALPAYPWLRYGWMRAWLDEVDRQGGMERVLSAARQEPLIRRALPSSMMDELERLWREREAFLDVLDRLPRTLCHRDLVPANLFACVTPSGQERLVAVDWAFVGIGPVGEDLAPLVLVPAPCAAGQLGPEELDELVFRVYVQGLRDAGWRGDERKARLGYTASAALRYGCLTAAVTLLHALDPTLREAMEARGGESVGGLLEREAERLSFVLGLAEEARG